MGVALEKISRITAKGQTTIPKAVRQALGVDFGGRIAFHIGDDGVMLTSADEGDDPAIESFLDFMARDIGHRPDRIEALTPELANRVAALTDGIPVHPDEAIEGDVPL